MARVEKHILLARINKVVEKGAENISDLSQELRRDIKDTIPWGVIAQGLKATHRFALQFLSPGLRKNFKWSGKK